MSICQIVLVSLIIFFLYRFLLKTIGIKQLGIWSLVLATTSVTQVVNLGLSGSVVKYVAKYCAREEHKNISEVIQTAAITLIIIVSIIIILAYPLIKYILFLVIAKDLLNDAVSLLPFTLGSLLLTIITGVFQSGLDGLQKIYIRNIITMLGAIIFALLCFIIAPKYGLIGLAYAQVINNMLVLILSWIMIKRCLPILPVIPYQWNKYLFKEIISYGVNFQIISISTLVYDPLTKALLSKFGGISIVGYYEMANKVVQQFRSLIVSANQAIVPAIANMYEKNPEKIKQVFITNYQLLLYFALPIFSTVIICAPLISKLWIGYYENIFVLIVVLLTIGNFLNTIAVPAYFSNLGTGDLRWNIAAHITIAMLNLILGIFLGRLYDGYGVVIAWTISLALGSSMIYLPYYLKNNIPLRNLLPKEYRIIAFSLILIIVCVLKLQKVLTVNSIYNNIILIVFSLFLMSIPLYFHPMRNRIIGWAKELMNRNIETIAK